MVRGCKRSGGGAECRSGSDEKEKYLASCGFSKIRKVDIFKRCLGVNGQKLNMSMRNNTQNGV